jgi:hypothetical protein
MVFKHCIHSCAGWLCPHSYLCRLALLKVVLKVVPDWLCRSQVAKDQGFTARSVVHALPIVQQHVVPCPFEPMIKVVASVTACRTLPSLFHCSCATHLAAAWVSKQCDIRRRRHPLASSLFDYLTSNSTSLTCNDDCLQDFAKAFCTLMELGVPFHEELPAKA